MLKNYAKILVLRKQNCFGFLDRAFNAVDIERRKEVGPDRSCAEWLLRNGAFVKWTNSHEFLADYNKLPDDNVKLYIEEVDATEASISQIGFEHFVGCEHIRKINFNKCTGLENEALKDLSPLKKSLRSLRICECWNITEKGLVYLTVLKCLKELILVNLPYVQEKETVIGQLRNELPKCNVTFD